MALRKKGHKPEDSRTVRQWALLGRIPVEESDPSYIWDNYGVPKTIYYLEQDTREMTEEEKRGFLANMKGYSEQYVQMVTQVLEERRKEYDE